jgi:hypothetical protein
MWDRGKAVLNARGSLNPDRHDRYASCSVYLTLVRKPKLLEISVVDLIAQYRTARITIMTIRIDTSMMIEHTNDHDRFRGIPRESSGYGGLRRFRNMGINDRPRV